MIQQEQKKFSRVTKNKMKMKSKDAGKKPFRLPSSNADLLHALAKMEQFLSGVQRSSSESITNALQPMIDVLIDKKLVKHPDMDVNISVCCCLCEIMRIMAPELPYTGKETKEFLKLVVTTFEKLSITSGGCYTRMTKFLDIYSNFSLPSLMSRLRLDDKLIVQLFKQFLNAADSNSPAVVRKMEEFMTMIIEESEPLNLELVDLLVTAVRKDNKIRSRFCWQLAENIIDSCADQLRPHLPHMESKECNPHTTDESKLSKETTHKIQLECLEDTDNLVDTHVEVKKDHVEFRKESLSFDKSPVSAISVTDVNRKRKRDETPQKKQVQSDEREKLVGSRIKVFWPDDNLYYPGVVKSFNCIREKHKLLYDDGDEEELDLEKEQWEFAENVSAMTDSLEREMGSSTESGITCVPDYDVNPNVEPILKAIIMKHGDIAAKCVYKGAHVRALFLERVCGMVRRMKTNDAIRMKEIETDLLDAEAANINVSWLRAHVEAIERKEDMKRCNLLMEMKVNSGLARKAAKMDLIERQIELMVAQQRFEEAEKCVKVLDLVQQKLSDDILEIEAK